MRYNFWESILYHKEFTHAAFWNKEIHTHIYIYINEQQKKEKTKNHTNYIARSYQKMDAFSEKKRGKKKGPNQCPLWSLDHSSNALLNESFFHGMTARSLNPQC